MSVPASLLWRAGLFSEDIADKCHHGKEENYLFKELVSKGIANEGGPVGLCFWNTFRAEIYCADGQKP